MTRMESESPTLSFREIVWDTIARPEDDEPRCGQKIFHQKNTCGEGRNPVVKIRNSKHEIRNKS
jgi:hypothetical protein